MIELMNVEGLGAAPTERRILRLPGDAQSEGLNFDALFRRLAEILIRKGGYRRRLDHDCRAIVTPMAKVARLG